MQNTVGKWQREYDRFLAVSPESDVQVEKPSFMDDECSYHPVFLVPEQDVFIEWVYTFDLDNGIFSVNNSAHLRLDQLPDSCVWIESIINGSLHDVGEKIMLPGIVPVECLTSPATAKSISNTNAEPNFGKTDAPRATMVFSKGLEAIPWTRRHGPLLRGLVFRALRGKLEYQLSATLLQWDPDDFPFREYAYAALCMAAGGKYLTILPYDLGDHNSAYGFLPDNQFTGSCGRTATFQPNKQHGQKEPREFFSQLGSGSHLQGMTPGSSPETTVYWMSGVLIFLVNKLYEPYALENGIHAVACYVEKQQIQKKCNALLCSIEHILLIKILSSGEIQHTGVMPLYNISSHLSLDVRDRYPASVLDDLKQRRMEQLKTGDMDREIEAPQLDNALHVVKSPHVQGDPDSTFAALVNFFDVCAYEGMAPAKPCEGCFPHEIYGLIIDNVIDRPTRYACMEVSRTFRNFCLEKVLLGTDMMILPSESSRDCVKPVPGIHWFNKQSLSSGERLKIVLQAPGFWEPRIRKYREKFLQPSQEDAFMQIFTGTQHDRKSRLPLPLLLEKESDRLNEAGLDHLFGRKHPLRRQGQREW
ncbi:MAG: hypothetical protein Q9219_000422 [cf. Caloplaca sp. 3 TL-2023]